MVAGDRQGDLACCSPWGHKESEVVKQEMARVNIDILGVSELKWTGMDKFNSDVSFIPEGKYPSEEME